MSKGVLYSNGVVSSLSQNLLSKDFLNRLSECNSNEDMKNLLEETSLNFSEENETINEKMQIETNKLVDFVKSESPSESFAQFFLLPFDYENIQTVCKCLYLNLDSSQFIQTEGLYTYQQIKDYIDSKNYRNFKNKFIENALESFNVLSQDKSLNGWEIETIFKKAKYENLLKISSNVLLKKLINSLATIENISIATRAKTVFEFESQIIDFGYLSKKELNYIFEKKKEILNYNLEESIFPFVKLALNDKSFENIVKFERLKQNFPASFFDKNKNNIETFAPFACYVYKKLNDIKNIRLAFSYVENGVGSETKKRFLNSEK